jgi:acetyltransferase-like isoleucine patch superfamily enzyme
MPKSCAMRGDCCIVPIHSGEISKVYKLIFFNTYHMPKTTHTKLIQQEHIRILQEIQQFLKSNKQVLQIYRKDTALNSTKIYHRVLRNNPFWFTCKAIIISVCTILPASTLKNTLLRWIGMKIGRDVSISWGVIFDFGYPKLITIQNGALIGTGVKILTHETTIKRIRIGRVDIGKQAVIGVRSIIRSGTKIGDNAVVGMGSVVIRNVTKNEFVGGVPAKRITMVKKVM